MTATRTLILARRVIQQLLADRRTIALILIVPLIVLSVAGILIRADTAHFNLAIISRDQGASLPFRAEPVNLGKRLADNLGDVSPNVTIYNLDAADARAKFERGELDALITLPEEFSRQTIETRELHFPVEFEGSNPMSAQLLEGLLTRAAIQALASLSLVGAPNVTIPSVKLEATYRYGGPDFDTLDYIAPVFIGLFAFMFVFILTSVAFLRERAAGTLERLQASPIRRSEIVVGYMLGFALFALAQALIILAYTILGLQVHYNGNLLVVFLVEALLALMAVNLGIFFSTFARNEFQVVQFIPLVVVTQVLLSGAFWAIEDMPAWLQPVAWLMPLTHANQALRNVMIKGWGVAEIMPQLLILGAFAAGLIVVSARTVQRQAGS